MDLLREIWHRLTDVQSLVRVGGLAAITAVIFAETGLMIGFFLPGDSLLFTAGAIAAHAQFSIVTLNVVLSLAAIAGDTAGYWIGRRAGPALFKKPKSLFFNPDHLRRAHDFYEQYGGKTIVLARFIPIIRTFAPVVAGMGRMEYRRFVFFNVFGGIGWVLSMTLAGYFLGRLPFVARHFEGFVLGIIVLSILPGAFAVLRERRRHRAAKSPETAEK
ncbi:MAG TPA: VTT domain-containing protein [Thermoanaerobaculia bacterium]|nr:VTT domain-containing protein [Thermoanaerobaculia bacterium]